MFIARSICKKIPPQFTLNRRIFIAHTHIHTTKAIKQFYTIHKHFNDRGLSSCNITVCVCVYICVASSWVFQRSAQYHTNHAYFLFAHNHYRFNSIYFSLPTGCHIESHKLRSISIRRRDMHAYNVCEAWVFGENKDYSLSGNRWHFLKNWIRLIPNK